MQRYQIIRYASSTARAGFGAAQGGSKSLASRSKCLGSELGSVTSWLLGPGGRLEGREEYSLQLSFPTYKIES